MSSQVSDEFAELFCSGFGSHVVDCGFCGITHIATGDERTFDDVEAQDLAAMRADATGEGYIEHPNDDFVSHGTLFGHTCIRECTCDTLGNYERWINHDRERIIRYFTKTAVRNCVRVMREVQDVGEGTFAAALQESFDNGKDAPLLELFRKFHQDIAELDVKDGHSQP